MPPLDVQLDVEPDEEPTPERGMLGRGWDMISQPLWNAPAQKGRELGESMSQPGLNDSWLKSVTKGLIGGIAEGAGGLVSSLTSPIDLAATALTGGSSVAAKAGAKGVSTALRAASRAASAPVAVHGGSEVLRPSASLSERATGLLELAGGIGGMHGGPEKGLTKIADNIKSGKMPSPKLSEPVEYAGPISGKKIDPNLNQGLGDPELAGSTPYKGGPTLDVIDDVDDIQVNASGESAASVEAMNRQKQMKSQGKQFGVYDRTGNFRPLIGPDAVDYVAKKGETYGIQSADGFSVLDDKGGKPPSVSAKASSVSTDNIITIKRGETTPDAVKKIREQGYVLVGSDADGNFKFQKSAKGPEKMPILETEIANKRATPSAVARQMESEGVPTETGKEPSVIKDLYNLPRATMASIDFSAPLRQGLGLIHKKEFYTSLKPMFQSWASQENFDANQAAILERPLFRPRPGPNDTVRPSVAEDAGLFLGDLSDISKREESIVSKIAEKIPGVKRSNRAYTAFLNNLRADTFQSLVNDANIFGQGGSNDIRLTRALADYVNTASGRGSLGKLERAAGVLNATMFSPRLLASRIQLINPQYYWSAPPMVRKEALKSLFAIAAAGNTVTQLGRLAGGEVSMDPSSSDFGKLKIGDTRIDPFGGFQQPIVAASRLLMGKVTSSTSGKEYDLTNPKGPYDPTHADVVERFARGKMHPTLGFVYSLLKGRKEMSGEKMQFTTPNLMENSIAQRFIPLVMQDMYEVSQENPELLPITVPLSTFGMGTQTYTGDRRP